ARRYPQHQETVLSLHDALPISGRGKRRTAARERQAGAVREPDQSVPLRITINLLRGHLAVSGSAQNAHVLMNTALPARWRTPPRSEEHTSELQSRENLVCRLLL